MKSLTNRSNPDLAELANALGVTEVSVFLAGVEDGYDQGPDPAVIMLYDEPTLQWEYDTGCHVGACLAARTRAVRAQRSTAH